MDFQNSLTHHLTTTTLKPTSILLKKKIDQPPKQPYNLDPPNIRQTWQSLIQVAPFFIVCIVLPFPFNIQWYLGFLIAYFYLHHCRPITSLSKQVYGNKRLCRIAHLRNYLYVQTLPTDMFRNYVIWINVFTLKQWWHESKFRLLTLLKYLLYISAVQLKLRVRIHGTIK